MCRHAIKKSSARFLHNRWHLGLQLTTINDRRENINNNQYAWGLNIQIMLIKDDITGNANDIWNGGHSLGIILCTNTRGGHCSPVHCAPLTDLWADSNKERSEGFSRHCGNCEKKYRLEMINHRHKIILCLLSVRLKTLKLSGRIITIIQNDIFIAPNVLYYTSYYYVLIHHTYWNLLKIWNQ